VLKVDRSVPPIVRGRDGGSVPHVIAGSADEGAAADVLIMAARSIAASMPAVAARLAEKAFSMIPETDARWFDTRSKALGDEYRDEVFANQSYIYNPNVLQQFTEKFAQAHGVALPFAIDPEGKLAAAVQADTDLGKNTGVVRTPTIFIVTASGSGSNYLEVLDADHDLYRTIDQALAQSRH